MSFFFWKRLAVMSDYFKARTASARGASESNKIIHCDATKQRRRSASRTHDELMVGAKIVWLEMRSSGRLAVEVNQPTNPAKSERLSSNDRACRKRQQASGHNRADEPRLHCPTSPL